MNVFFTSDLHFGHFNIIKYCNRPWNTVQEMNEGLIHNWNARVTNSDKIWILGDVFFCREEYSCNILERLNGKKHLILGNHDKLIKKSEKVQSYFEKIYPDLYEESINGKNVVMCHYPMLTWNRSGRGAYMLHGHTHNNIPFDDKVRRLDVGVDTQNYAPISWEQVVKKLEVVTLSSS